MGAAQTAIHIEENLSFWSAHGKSSNLRPCFGLHANFTLSEESLKAIAHKKPQGLAIHIHCGEDRADLEYCREQGYEGPAHRLAEHGLLDDRSILAHAVHLSERDYGLLEEIHPIVVSNPESNANNQVGSMVRKRIAEYVLGTDGMSGDLLQTLRSHFLLGEGRKESFEGLRRVFFSNKIGAQQKYFPNTGTLEPGARADIAVLDYIPLAPISLDALMGHLLFGAKTGKAFLTISDGVIIFRDGVVTTIDESDLVREVRDAAQRLHRRYYG
jgi:cytosine/adenosine deaminase-related metal-dependent hydrolase